MYRLLVSLFLLLPLCTVAEPVRYVTDTLTVPLRTGTTTEHKILKMLPSGTEVEVLEADSENTRVRVQGAEGWILTRFLEDVPAARDRLAQEEQKMATLQEENNRLQSAMKEITDQHAKTDRIIQKLRDDNQRIQAELHRTIDSLRQENATLKDRTARDWFVAGAMVALTTLVVSLFIPKMVQWRRRTRWNTL